MKKLKKKNSEDKVRKRCGYCSEFGHTKTTCIGWNQTKKRRLHFDTTQTLIFNARLDAAICAVFVVMVLTILIDSMRIWIGILQGTKSAKVVEAPFVLSQLSAEGI